MKKLYTLKSWFSLPDAAKRLAAGLDEEVSVADILQLAVEGLLPISWYIRHVPARRVAKYTALYGMGYSPKFFELHNKLFPDNPLSPNQLIASERWECVDGEDSIVYLEGPYRLELEYCGALKEWIHGYMTQTSSELTSLDGFFVSDNQGDIWQIMEYEAVSVRKTPDGDEKRTEAYYYPSVRFPEESELVLQRRDIEAFEESLMESSITEPTILPQRAETTYLHMIAALLGVITEGIPSADTSGGQIGPAANFKNEAQLIEAISQHFKGYAGLSKSTLSRKLPEAKRALQSG